MGQTNFRCRDYLWDSCQRRRLDGISRDVSFGKRMWMILREMQFLRKTNILETPSSQENVLLFTI